MRDIGANLTSPQFARDLPAVLERARAAGVRTIDVTGTSLDNARQALALARAHPGFLTATAGCHPHHAKDWDRASAEALHRLLAEPEVRMAGEMGLDFDRNFSTPPQQRLAFEAQLEVAAEFADKPLFLHCRSAHPAFLEIMDRRPAALTKVIVHCFTDGLREAQAYLERGFYIGVTGWVSDDRRATALREALAEIPIERLLIETDAPYLRPMNLPEAAGRRGRNEPAFLVHVARALAPFYGLSATELGAMTARNADQLIGSALHRL
ncbi:MAG: TatD family hydrolase [Pseudomonadota bacterium]